MEHTVKDVLNLLKSHGFYEIRIVGDHHRLTNGKGKFVTIAYSELKDDIPLKTYNLILKQANLK
ncbi:addiction module toxin, HicA family [Companilactobacillus zhachilii]|uniref:Addiction module toxin, HicA family n=1 Tax=Companilactobacillus zhachilii TaxID=2304606 RepID=A0A386PXT4_9LACO|nr:type II toxin-antitoxin system HicA family toxin [Companilactobacillus zhachilii]AYE39317.1 addiction module toxin, HicA family [Companilactobacillus zhachilii]